MKWIHLSVYNKNVIYQTERSALIKMPNNSDYKGYKFWHPLKLVQYHGDYTIIFSGNFVFNLFKNGNGKYNKKEIVDRIELSAGQVEEAFKNDSFEILDPYETHKPEILEPEKAEALKELIDD